MPQCVELISIVTAASSRHACGSPRPLYSPCVLLKNIRHTARAARVAQRIIDEERAAAEKIRRQFESALEASLAPETVALSRWKDGCPLILPGFAQ